MLFRQFVQIKTFSTIKNSQLPFCLGITRRLPVIKKIGIAWHSRKAKTLEDSIEVKFIKSSGPGGQSVNKLNSKAEVRLKISEATWIPVDVREKLNEKEKNRINKDGVLVVTSDKFRVQSRNLKDALDKIRSMITEASYVPEGPSADQVKKVLASIEKENERRLQDKKFRSEKKNSRFLD